MKQLLATVTLERERMEHSRKITSSRTQSSNNKLQARRIYMSRGTSCASIDSLPEGEPEDGFFEGSDDDDDDEREAAFVTNATVEEVDAALGNATGAQQRAIFEKSRKSAPKEDDYTANYGASKTTTVCAC
jgi:hypothetical protein